MEANLKERCREYGISLTEERNGKQVMKNASRLKEDLTKIGCYKSIQSRNIEAIITVRNKAAHGSFSEYALKDVEAMMSSLLAIL